MTAKGKSFPYYTEFFFFWSETHTHTHILLWTFDILHLKTSQMQFIWLAWHREGWWDDRKWCVICLDLKALP